MVVRPRQGPRRGAFLSPDHAAGASHSAQASFSSAVSAVSRNRPPTA
jgi:hypothetical protein